MKTHREITPGIWDSSPASAYANLLPGADSKPISIPLAITPERITELKPDEIFVFGSNRAGRHGAGAALLAWKKFGAVTYNGVGRMGQCYAIPTKDHNIETLSPTEIVIGVIVFLQYAGAHQGLHFLVTQIGCGLAGYSPKVIAPMFGKDIPPNVSLPASFWEVILK